MYMKAKSIWRRPKLYFSDNIKIEPNWRTAKKYE